MMLALSTNALSANMITATSSNVACDTVLKACDKALEQAEEHRQKLLEVYGLQQKTIAEQEAEIGRLRVQNDAWYERNPLLVFGIGVLAGGVIPGEFQDVEVEGYAVRCLALIERQAAVFSCLDSGDTSALEAVREAEGTVRLAPSCGSVQCEA